MKENKKEINWKENILASKWKGKWKMFETIKKKHDLRKQLDTIVYPDTMTTLFCTWM